MILQFMVNSAQLRRELTSPLWMWSYRSTKTPQV